MKQVLQRMFTMAMFLSSLRGLRCKEQLPRITDEKVLVKYKASFLQNGDVDCATDTAEDTTVGKCRK